MPRSRCEGACGGLGSEGVSAGLFQAGVAAGLRRRPQEPGAGAVSRDALGSPAVLGAGGCAGLRGRAGRGEMRCCCLTLCQEELEVPREGGCLTVLGSAFRLSGRA